LEPGWWRNIVILEWFLRGADAVGRSWLCGLWIVYYDDSVGICLALPNNVSYHLLSIWQYHDGNMECDMVFRFTLSTLLASASCVCASRRHGSGW
jgi:hypothetical protein